MTWQRIDDDTYIDDTLVTCAEYQLFIDEMREQGEYHQPYHWISYQFPSGEARTPIIGVGWKDARAFCEWLTKRRARSWIFRLPTPTEAKFFLSAKSKTEDLLGYWAAEKDVEFIWTNPPSLTQLSLDIKKFVQSLEKNEVENAITKDKDSSLFRTIDEVADSIAKEDKVRNRIRIFNFKCCRNNNLLAERDINVKHSEAVALIKSTILDCASNVNYIRAIIYYDNRYTRNLDEIINFIREANLFKTGSFLSELDRNTIDNYPILMRDDDFARHWQFLLEEGILGASFLAMEELRNNRRDNRHPGIYIKPVEELRLEVYDKLALLLFNFVIRERIAGRSPAFEGIRLVKERIK